MFGGDYSEVNWVAEDQAQQKVRTVSVFKTAVFKIHNPSQHKRAMLRDALKRSHVAFGKLLERHFPDENEVARLSGLPKRDLRVAMNQMRATMEKHASRWKHLSGGAKPAIALDAAGLVASHLELRGVQAHAGRPTVTEINSYQPEYEAALDAFRDAIELHDENELRDEIARITRMGLVRPLGFYKVRRSDGFILLRHPETDRVYVWLNLHPQTSRHATPVEVRELINLQTGEVISFKSRTGALFPLEMSHAFHDAGFIQRGRPQTARLVWRRERNGSSCDEFELHVAFKWETLAVETDKWLGVDRGIYNLAAFSVVDDDGRVVHEASVTGRDLRHVQRQFERQTAAAQRKGHFPKGKKRRAWADEAVHVAANALVQSALEHGARIVLEDLSSFSAISKRKREPGRRRSGFNRLLNRKQYEKLKQVLSYKLKEFGLPDPVFIRPAGTSITCPECGRRDAANRIKKPIPDGFQMDTFKCTDCAYEADADLNAARVIAMKGAWLRQLPRKPKRGKDGRFAEELTFEPYLYRCAARRGGAPAP